VGCGWERRPDAQRRFVPPDFVISIAPSVVVDVVSGMFYFRTNTHERDQPLSLSSSTDSDRHLGCEHPRGNVGMGTWTDRLENGSAEDDSLCEEHYSGMPLLVDYYL
jgi:hypothetical protein